MADQNAIRSRMGYKNEAFIWVVDIPYGQRVMFVAIHTTLAKKLRCTRVNTSDKITDGLPAFQTIPSVLGFKGQLVAIGLNRDFGWLAMPRGLSDFL